MSTQGLRFLIFFVCVLAIGSGCAGVPPIPRNANTRAANARSASGGLYEEDEQGGWLFDRLTGRDRSASRQDAPSEVVAASASEPVALPPVSEAAASPAVPAAAPKSDDHSGFELSDLDPDNIYKRIKKAAGYGPNEGVARALIKEGEGLFRQRKYSEAAGRFKSAAGRWPDSTLEEDALFMLGESYFFSDRYPKAQDTYGKLLKKYSNSRHVDTVTRRLFAIGRYWEQLHEKNPHWPITPNLADKEQPTFDTFGNALKAYQAVSENDPTGPLADDAIMATANAYFRKNRFEDAGHYYDMLRTEYPNSEHQAQAHLLGLQSKLRKYQGAQYDRTPLEEADEIAAQTLTQFRSQLGDEQARVAETRQRIVEEKARRDWAMAQYYDNKKQFGAARFYYQSIVKDYPLTQYARRAKARLEAIRNQPDNPSNRFKWLTDLFPADE